MSLRWVGGGSIKYKNGCLVSPTQVFNSKPLVGSGICSYREEYSYYWHCLKLMEHDNNRKQTTWCYYCFSTLYRQYALSLTAPEAAGCLPPLFLVGYWERLEAAQWHKSRPQISPSGAETTLEKHHLILIWGIQRSQQIRKVVLGYIFCPPTVKDSAV